MPMVRRVEFASRPALEKALATVRTRFLVRVLAFDIGRLSCARLDPSHSWVSLCAWFLPAALVPIKLCSLERAAWWPAPRQARRDG